MSSHSCRLSHPQQALVPGHGRLTQLRGSSRHHVVDAYNAAHQPLQAWHCLPRLAPRQYS
ncbi:hypothetical protein [Arthrobacter sp. Ld5]|uniref:hypothetical protein n=1 Tax=Arthrobacter sp. Ld5 TaxID=649152 RepID=UPI003EBF6FE2